MNHIQLNDLGILKKIKICISVRGKGEKKNFKTVISDLVFLV